MWTKPLTSVTRERGKETTAFYYLAWVRDIGKISARCKVARPPQAYFYTKEDIDKFPMHLRRGGRYGHDEVRLAKYGRPDKLPGPLFVVDSRNTEMIREAGNHSDRHIRRRRDINAEADRIKFLCRAYHLKFTMVTLSGW